MKNRLLVFGDIHGEYDKLINLWEKVKFNPENDKLIFLGDYIDRGPEPLKCLDFIIDKVNNYNAIALSGNHENMMLYDTDCWFNNGGKETLKKLRSVSKEEQEKYIEFCNDLRYYHEEDNMIFVHAGINPDIADWHEDIDSMLWIRGEFLSKYNGNKKVFVGHTPVQYLRGNNTTPTKVKNIVMIDTGSYLSDGHISCVDAYTLDFWMSD